MPLVLSPHGIRYVSGAFQGASTPIDQVNDARGRETLLESKDRSNEFWEVPADFLPQLQELSQHPARRVLQRS